MRGSKCMGWPQSAWKRVYVRAVMVLSEGMGGRVRACTPSWHGGEYVLASAVAEPPPCQRALPV